MASPIRWFRKHSQFLIVVFGVFLMAIFGLGSVFTTLNPSTFGRNIGGENTVVAKWSGGEINQQDLSLLRQRHFAAQRLLNEVQRFAIEQNDGKTFPIAAEPIMPIIGQGENPTAEEMDARMLDRFLYAERAKQDGFMVDDNMVIEYIAQFAGDIPISKNLLKQINRQVNPQTPLTAVVRHLKLELLSQQLENMTQGGLPFVAFSQAGVNAINPTEAIELYSRTTKRIDCQVLPVSVQEYVSQVDEVPSEIELRELYEKGKYEYPYLNYEEPGFKNFNQAKIQYFVAELETFLQNEIAKLTDAEVQEEYNRLIEADDNLVMEVVPVESKQGSDEPGTDAGDDTGASGEMKKEDVPSDSGLQEPSAIADEPDAPESETSPVDNATPSDDDGEAGQPEQKTETSLKQDPAADAEQQASDQTEGKEPEDPESGNPAAGEPDMVDSNPSSEITPSEDDQSGESDPNSEVFTDQDSVVQDPVMEDEPETERKPRPLVNVADDIKRRMKSEAARTARDDAMDEAEKELRKYQMEVSKWEYDGEEKGVPRPEAPDFKAIADRLGIQFRETGLIDPSNIRDEPIGQIVTFEIGPNRQPMQVNIGQQIFREFDATPVYQPAKVDDFSNSSKVVYWMSEKVDQKVPSFEEARESVIEYWKRTKAIELATQAAQKIADEVNSGEQGLKDLYPQKALETGTFTWYTTFGQFSYGRPAGVEDPGEEFMEMAFSLPENEAGVALNGTRDTVYVIQPIPSVTMSLEQLGTDYLEKNFFLTRRVPQEVISTKARYRQALNLEWLREFRDEMQVQVIGQ